MNSSMTMNDEAFARLVAEEVKNKVSRTQRKVLLDKENWDKWRRALNALLDTLQDQIDNIEADEESDRERYSSLGSEGRFLLSQALSEYASRKTKIERFRFHVERRLDEVEQMISTGEVPEDDPTPNAKLYENAIRKHKQLIEKFDIEPTPIDIALWDALDGLWTFNKVRSSDLMSDE